ncbi:molybdenum cofactor biosynthesis protein MoaE [Schaalia sp. ZJ1691]|uniref:molybdenum cofactor biosynthesis protein MoaE n=1 Tax=Schaalia sp. ZJ1691 TaxID=2709404 RepID=UPI0013EDBF3D|nr:molybdenum cofactor biosynthesis protein MoaE [Schaalia sp. ZJ1691]
MKHVKAAVVEHELDSVAITHAVHNQRCGAVVTFLGVVRNHDGDMDVEAIDYSAHDSAQTVLHAIALELVHKPGIHGIEVWHRIGHLRVGDLAMVVAVAGEHRREAFDTAEELVERVKKSVPVWKRQWMTDGTYAWSGL